MPPAAVVVALLSRAVKARFRIAARYDGRGRFGNPARFAADHQEDFQ
jgi:hypothetical protein